MTDKNKLDKVVIKHEAGVWGALGTAAKASGSALGKASPYIAVASLLVTAFKLFRDYATRASRACIDLKGPDKPLCKTEIELDGLIRGLAALRRARGECGKTKNPDKCRQSIDKHILRTQTKIAKLKTRNASYQKIKMITAREKALAAAAERRAGGGM